MAILKLQPSFKDYIWGGSRLKTEFGKEYDGDVLAESWELSCHPDGPSRIVNGTYQGETLDDYIKKEGQEVLGKNCRRFEEFPILIKFIDAKDNLSIQVHPDNGYALKNEGQYGKTEMWYIVDCKEGAYLYYGFSKEISQSEFKKRIEEDTLLEVLNKVPVQKGDVLFIEAGTIHAIGKDIVIAEIQQNSNVTYRVYDYGRVDKDGNQRDLHIEKALAVTERVPILRNKSAVPHLAKCDYFTVDKLHLDGSTMKKITGSATEESFISILVLAGEGVIRCEDEILELKKGDSFFLPAGNGEYEIEGYCEAIVTTIGEKASPIRISVEMSSLDIRMGLWDVNQKCIWEHAIPFDNTLTYEETTQQFCKEILEILQRMDIGVDNCIGMGVGIPGSIDSNRGEVLYSNNIKWKNVPLAQEIKRYIPIPVYMSNNASCALIGEKVSGVAKNYENIVLFTVGNGVGSGIMLNGHMFEGGLVGGSELGHTLLRKGGAQCTCGRKGCLESYVSKAGLIRETKNVMMNDQDSLMWNSCNGNLDVTDEFTALKCIHEDGSAKMVWENYCENLSEGIVNAINVFRPDMVVICGFFKEYEEEILPHIKNYIQELCFGGEDSLMPNIVITDKKEQKGLLGAANLI